MAALTYRVSAAALNLRAGPGTAAAVVAVMLRGETCVSAGPAQGGWIPAVYKGRSGFASAAHLAVEPGQTAAPAANESVATASPVAPAAQAAPGVDTKLRDLAALHPLFRSRLSQLLDGLRAESLPFSVFEAFRTPQRQQHLFAQGRTRSGSIVTNAPPWKSNHQFGLAADLVLFIDGAWSWSDSGALKSHWTRMAELAADAGLHTLNFERPHVELPFELANWGDGSLLASGDAAWQDNLARHARLWTEAGGNGAPTLNEPDAERPPLDLVAA